MQLNARNTPTLYRPYTEATRIVDLPLDSILNNKMTDLTEAATNREALKAIKKLYLTGKISRDKAQELAEPFIRRANARAEQVAKRHNKKPYSFNFSSLIRDSYQ